MERIFILAIILLGSIDSMSQNLLLNGDFESILETDGSKDFYLKNFYNKDWIEPTDCSPDIYRDKSICSLDYVTNIENEMDMCISTVSGNYAIGFIALNYYGYMEHLTGELRNPLEAGGIYKVSFYLKYFGYEPFFSKGIGYKFSKDSIVFESDEVFTYKLSPYYQDLFKQKKVYADFEFNEYLIDTVWTKYTTTFIANGEEKYITFGQFSFRDDNEVVKQLKYLRQDATEKKLHNFVASGKSEYLKYFADLSLYHDYQLGGNYYLLDKIEVTKLSEEEKSLYNKDCSYCVDLDPMTTMPSFREVTIDKGFVGDMKIELGVRLKPMEKYVLEYGKKCKIIIINIGTNDEYSEMKYLLEYSARKLRKKPVRFYVEKTNIHEMDELKSSSKKVEEINDPKFKGVIIKN
jgi:hypothetical protein